MKKLLLLLILASVAAYAVDYDISEGSVSIKSGGKYTVTGSTTENSIDIDTADDVEITLDNVSITDVESSFRINRGNVTLILVGSNTLDVWDAGIYVGASAALTISAESTGSLTIKNDMGTGIGGRRYGTSGPITINGGTLKIDSYGEAAIGGGMEGAAGTVTINGGTITAISYGGGAGIGGGDSGTAGTVIINGGTIKAESYSGGASIGGGARGTAGTVIINGGTIKAKSYAGGAGIGGGYRGTAGTVIIKGGTVKAEAR
ncbi:carbohydrate-binding domain-containing protein, partial [bacterium]|nr:carbohydrate-binding domain-containing protein [bacterium]